jgi:cysteinyl-tRNA synthetase
VIYVRNITDVDDKINLAASQARISIQELTQNVLKQFYADIGALNVLKPSFEPKVTESIPEIIATIQKLIDNNHAYISQNHVLFDISSFKDYGKLSKKKLEDLISGARVEIADYKKNPLDFVLWKPSSINDDISSIFDSPWGRGRPGWHIECSAMSHKFLGENFDIHGGGADLQFPHHENEIAQSCCAHPHSNYASLWVHNGFLTVDGEKMSKSLKNFITVNDLLERGIEGVVIRLMLLSSHYRKPFDFNQKIVDDCQKTLEKFHEIFDKKDYDQMLQSQDSEVSEAILEFLADDLNFSKVLAFLNNSYKEIKNNFDKNKLQQFIKNLDFLGLVSDKMWNKNISKNNLSGNLSSNFSSAKIDENFINQQIILRKEFKSQKNFSEADKIRQALLNMGIILEDKPDGSTIFSYRRIE